jgi:hypothetical protein
MDILFPCTGEKPDETGLVIFTSSVVYFILFLTLFRKQYLETKSTNKCFLKHDTRISLNQQKVTFSVVILTLIVPCMIDIKTP